MVIEGVTERLLRDDSKARLLMPCGATALRSKKCWLAAQTRSDHEADDDRVKEQAVYVGGQQRSTWVNLLASTARSTE